MDKAKYLKLLHRVKPDPDKKTADIWEISQGVVAADKYDKGKLSARYIIDMSTGEHYSYDYSAKKWSSSKMRSTFAKTAYYYWHYDTDDLKKEYTVTIGKSVKKQCKHSSDIVRDIYYLEQSYDSQKRSSAEDRRKDRIKGIMERVPELPEDFTDWYFRVSGLDNLNYLIYDEESEKFRCTRCGKKIVGSGIKNLKMTVCPNCGNNVTPRKNRNQLEITVRGAAALIQRIDNDNVVARYMDVWAVYDKYGRSIKYSEAERVVYTAKTIKTGFVQHLNRVYYAQFGSDEYANDYYRSTGTFDWKSNPCQRRTRSGYLYPGDMAEILKGSEIENKKYMLQAVADRGICVNTARMISCTVSDESRQTVEYAAKLGYQRLIREAFEARHYSHDLATYLYDGESEIINHLTQLPKQERNRLRDLDGGYITYSLLQYVSKHGMKVSDAALTWFEDNRIYPDVIFGYREINPEVIMHYLIRQKKESYPKLIYKDIMDEWLDYLSMARGMKKAIDDDMNFRPAKLKLRHDQLVEEKRQKEAIEEARRNKAQAKAREKELKERYPKAEATLGKIRKKYEYQNDDFMVIVPKKLYDIVQEGYMLHHCVGATDRYFERMERNETYICFLRRTSEPDMPYYTIEIEPGGTIRQHRSFYDEEPGIEEIRDFLREWQKVIKKRLTAADKKAAEESKRLGELNLEELLRTKGKNDRVYKALLEDYLEAI